MEGQKNYKGKLLKVITSQPFILFIFIILVAVVTNSVNDKFLTASTINSILGQAAGLGLVSAGGLRSWSSPGISTYQREGW